MICEFCKEEINDTPTYVEKKYYHYLCHLFVAWIKKYKDKVKKLIKE